jgi:deoxyribodipyrimidine photolyase-related protein
LFWSFVGTHLEFFRKQYRLGMLVRNWEKMDEDKKQGHIDAAQAFFSS